VRSARIQATRVLAAACALSAAAWGAASVTTGATAATAATARPASGLASPRVQPAGLHIFGRVSPDTVLTTAQCQAIAQISCYSPNEIQQVYGLNSLYSANITGNGTTIVIVDAYGSPTLGDDLAEFDNQSGLPNISLNIIAPVGKIPAFDLNNGDMYGWAGETTLDVEYAHSIAPGAKIVLVEAPSDNTQDLTNAVQYAVNHRLGNVITQSFGEPEQDLGAKEAKAAHAIYSKAAAEHITVLASTGDTGATGYTNSGNFYTHAVASWPASDPDVTAMGGTALNLSDEGNRLAPDVAWNDTYNNAVSNVLYGTDGPNPNASGGGKSVIFGRPSFQNPVKNVVGSSRGIPDISMSGACDGTVEIYQGYGGLPVGWYPVCGTSESSPMFAGIVALADQKAGHSLGDINAAIYKLAAEHAKGIVLVTSGNNTVAFAQGGNVTVHGYSARKGYSLVAGVGTINAAYFVPELAHLG
jgi:subtilase family serine protease